MAIAIQRILVPLDFSDHAGPVLEWVTQQDGEEMRFDVEPGTSAWQRIRMWFLSLLPIEGQL